MMPTPVLPSATARQTAFPLWMGLLALLLCLCFAPLHAAPATSNGAMPTLPDLPNRTDLQTKLDQLSKREALTAVEKARREDLEKTLASLDTLDKEKDQFKNQQKTLDAAPGQLQQLSDELDNLRKPVDPDKLTKQVASLTLTQLDKRMSAAMTELQQAQEELATTSSQLTNLQTLPERAQVSMSQGYSRSQDIRNQLNGSGGGKNDVTPTQRTALNAELAVLTMQLARQQKDLDNNTLMQDLALKRQSLASNRIANLEKEIEALQARINTKRLSNTEQTAADAVSDTTEQKNVDPVVEKEQKTNQQLSKRLINTTEQINQLVQENIKIKGWLERVTQTERNLNEQISMLKGSLLLSRILYQQRQMLPNANITGNLDEMIADLRLSQFEINQQRDQLFQRDPYLDKLMQGSATPTDTQVRTSLSDLLDSRKELLDQLNNQLGTQLNLAINIKLNQQQLERVNQSLKFTLQQQMFWVSSNKPLDWGWFTGLPKAMRNQIEAVSIDFDSKAWATSTLPLLLVVIPLVVVGILLRWKRQLLRDKVAKWSKDIGKLTRDSQLLTPKCLLFTGLEVLPGALIIMALGFLFLFSGLSEPRLIWFLALRLSAAYMAFSVLLKILRPGGMAETHFGQTPAEVAYKYRALKYVWRSLIPLIVVATMGELDPSRLANDAIGQVITLTMLVITLVLVYPLFRARIGQQRDVVHWLGAAMLAIAPIALIVLVVLGYYYTALKLTNRFIDTFYMFMAWSIIQKTAFRGLAIAARRLAHRRAVARREQLKQQEDADTTELLEEKPISLEEISQQSLRLTKVLLFMLFIGCFYWLWSDLVAVLSYLDSITLWHYSVASGNSEILQPVSLRDLLMAGVIAVAAWVLTTNLPGLLEVLVLSQLQLGQGANYTITTTLSYAITSFGAIFALSALGLSWDKLQWLVAALSVGLGFGLQEIFANFVSGIIILFERPVRIGDVITLNGFSGSVTKIRIRATTVTDFDRKEIIVPNKMFITGQLTNWSLSDTTTRIILRIGVAYGSDLDKTKELLLRAANENSRVMKEPEPVVYFLNFGASTLDHEMRLFVRELGDRNPAVDEINRAIDRLFREHGIEIAFNQVDVYVKNIGTGNEQKLESSDVAQIAAAAAVQATPPAPAV